MLDKLEAAVAPIVYVLPLTHERRERLIHTHGTIAHSADMGPVLFGPAVSVEAAITALNALPALLRLARADLTLRDLERQYVDSTDGMFDEFVKVRWGAAVEERNAALAALEAQP